MSSVNTRGDRTSPAGPAFSMMLDDLVPAGEQPVDLVVGHVVADLPLEHVAIELPAAASRTCRSHRVTLAGAFNVLWVRNARV